MATFFSIGVEPTPSSHRSSSAGATPSGAGQDRRRGPGWRSWRCRGRRPGWPRSPPARASRPRRIRPGCPRRQAVEHEADAHAGGVGRGQRLHLALVGPHLGVGAPGHVDLDALAGGRARATTRLRQIEELVASRRPSERHAGDAQRRLARTRPGRSGRPCRRCPASCRSRWPRRRCAAAPRGRCRSGWRRAAAR